MSFIVYTHVSPQHVNKPPQLLASQVPPLPVLDALELAVVAAELDVVVAAELDAPPPEPDVVVAPVLVVVVPDAVVTPLPVVPPVPAPPVPLAPVSATKLLEHAVSGPLARTAAKSQVVRFMVPP